MEVKEGLKVLNEWLGRVRETARVLGREVNLIKEFRAGERYWEAIGIYERLAEFRKRRVDPLLDAIKEGFLVPRQEKRALVGIWLNDGLLDKLDFVLVKNETPFGIDAKIVGTSTNLSLSGLTLFDLWLVHDFSVLCSPFGFHPKRRYEHILSSAVGVIQFLLKFVVSQDFIKECFLSSSFGECIGGDIVAEILEGGGVKEGRDSVEFIKKFVGIWVSRYMYKRLEEIGLVNKTIVIADRQIITYLVYHFGDWFRRFPSVIAHPMLLKSVEICKVWKDNGEVGMSLCILDAERGLRTVSASGFWIPDLGLFVDRVFAQRSKEELIKFFDSFKQELDRKVELLRYIIFSGSDRVEIREKDDV